MFSKLTAIILLALMTMAIATSQRALNYCACLEKLSIGDCGCSEEVFSDSCCSSSCHSDSCGENDLPETKRSECSSSRCLIALFFEIDAFLNSTHEIRGKNSNGNELSFHLPYVDIFLKSEFLSIAYGSRGPPPRTTAITDSVPLFIRHSILLI